jgi:hypothetical protein
MLLRLLSSGAGGPTRCHQPVLVETHVCGLSELLPL